MYAMSVLGVMLLYFQSTMELAKTHAKDPNALKVIFSSIVLECKIFYSLNFQVTCEMFDYNGQQFLSSVIPLCNSCTVFQAGNCW